MVIHSPRSTLLQRGSLHLLIQNSDIHWEDGSQWIKESVEEVKTIVAKYRRRKPCLALRKNEGLKPSNKTYYELDENNNIFIPKDKIPHYNLTFRSGAGMVLDHHDLFWEETENANFLDRYGITEDMANQAIDLFKNPALIALSLAPHRLIKLSEFQEENPFQTALRIVLIHWLLSEKESDQKSFGLQCPPYFDKKQSRQIENYFDTFFPENIGQCRYNVAKVIEFTKHPELRFFDKHEEDFEIVDTPFSPQWINLVNEGIKVLKTWCDNHIEREAYQQHTSTSKNNGTDLLSKRFVPNPVQKTILKLLDGKALRKSHIELKGSLQGRLYPKNGGGIKELMDLNKVNNHSRLGFYRPDAPPPELTSDDDI